MSKLLISSLSLARGTFCVLFRDGVNFDLYGTAEPAELAEPREKPGLREPPKEDMHTYLKVPPLDKENFLAILVGKDDKSKFLLDAHGVKPELVYVNDNPNGEEVLLVPDPTEYELYDMAGKFNYDVITGTIKFNKYGEQDKYGPEFHAGWFEETDFLNDAEITNIANHFSHLEKAHGLVHAIKAHDKHNEKRQAGFYVFEGKRPNVFKLLSSKYMGSCEGLKHCAGPIVMAASQENFLENRYPNLPVSAGTATYILDNTQGPQCAMAGYTNTVIRQYGGVEGEIVHAGIKDLIQPSHHKNQGVGHNVLKGHNTVLLHVTSDLKSEDAKALNVEFTHMNGYPLPHDDKWHNDDDDTFCQIEDREYNKHMLAVDKKVKGMIGTDDGLRELIRLASTVGLVYDTEIVYDGTNFVGHKDTNNEHDKGHKDKGHKDKEPNKRVSQVFASALPLGYFGTDYRYNDFVQNLGDGDNALEHVCAKNKKHKADYDKLKKLEEDRLKKTDEYNGINSDEEKEEYIKKWSAGFYGRKVLAENQKAAIHLAIIVLAGQFYGTFMAAAKNLIYAYEVIKEKHPGKPDTDAVFKELDYARHVYLNGVGTGVFGNDMKWLWEHKSHDIHDKLKVGAVKLGWDVAVHDIGHERILEKMLIPLFQRCVFWGMDKERIKEVGDAFDIKKHDEFACVPMGTKANQECNTAIEHAKALYKH